jgi:uncharacterized membrane protein YoaK (UPF0700 family)
MFRHRGVARTFRQNLRLAVFLSFTAGLVNICGVLALGVLTTNVTGHFAYFSQFIQKHDFLYALNFLLYILAFLFGAFMSSFITEYFIKKGSIHAHNTVIILEIVLLLMIGIRGDVFLLKGVRSELLACILLFTMGLQNSLVTSISRAQVRTTHLTGLFTDLGIELSQMFYYKQTEQRHQLKKSIGLRCTIIAFFFLGCICGSFFYQSFELKTLILAAVVLVVAIFYDNLRVTVYRFYKKLVHG